MSGLPVPGALAGRVQLCRLWPGTGVHKARLIYECAACGKQHSLLAGTIFEQTKTGLARWFLAIWPLQRRKANNF